MAELPKEGFKPAGADDIAFLLQLMRGFYEEENYTFNDTARETISEFLDRPEWGRIWLVELEGQCVGYLALTFGFNFEHGGRSAFIDEFYILKDYRSRGMGRRVMNFAEEHAALEGCRSVHLEVERKNKKAERLYQNRGYRTTNRKLLTKNLSDESNEKKAATES